jgi:hypothetical protein
MEIEIRNKIIIIGIRIIALSAAFLLLGCLQQEPQLIPTDTKIENRVSRFSNQSYFTYSKSIAIASTISLI